jgi:hypothetical protein
LKLFVEEQIDLTNPFIICEKVITENRRIDLFMKFNKTLIAVENKIWSNDQNNQLKDYSSYLNEKSNGKYLLIYLTPFGNKPSKNSIEDELLETLLKSKQIKILSYKKDIFKLLDDWITSCESENVRYFLRQFKLYLIKKFFGNKTMNITNSLRGIIYSNQTEIETLIAAYVEIEKSILKKHEKIIKHLQNEFNVQNEFVTIEKIGPFPHEGKKVYRFDISLNQNKICIQLIKDKVNLKINYFFDKSTDERFKDFARSKEIKKMIIDNENSNDQIIKLFKEQVNLIIVILIDFKND